MAVPRQMQSKLLIAEPPLQVLPSLALRFGLNKAVFAQQLHYMLINPDLGKWVDEEKWIYATMEEWKEIFPFWSIPTIRIMIKQLVGAGVVKEGNYNEELSRRKWYTLDYDKLDIATLRKPRKIRADYVNFGAEAKRLRMSKVSTMVSPNFGVSNVQSFDVDSSKSPSKTSPKNIAPASLDALPADPIGQELDAPLKNKHLTAYKAKTAANRLSSSALDFGEPLPSSPASTASDYDVYAAYSEWSSKVTRTLHLAVGTLTLCQRDTATLKHLPAGEPDKGWTYSVQCRACSAELDRRAADALDETPDIASVPEVTIASSAARTEMAESQTNIGPSQPQGNNADRTMRWTDALTGREMAVLPAAGIYQKHFKSVADHSAAGEWSSDEYVYIGRANASKRLPASKWANPFVMHRESERQHVIDQYRAYLYDHPELIRAIPELRNHTLVCWCKPKECHGDVLVQFASMDDAWIEAQAVIADANAAAIAADALAKKNDDTAKTVKKAPQPHIAPIVAWVEVFDPKSLPAGFKLGAFSRFSKTLYEDGVTPTEMTCAAELYKAWLEAVKVKPTLTWSVAEVTEEVRRAISLCRRGVTAEGIARFVKDCYADAWWTNKLVSFKHVANNIIAVAPTPKAAVAVADPKCKLCGGSGLESFTDVDNKRAFRPCSCKKVVANVG